MNIVKEFKRITISINKNLADAIEKLANSYREYDKECVFPEYKSSSQCYEDLLMRGYEDKKKEEMQREIKWSNIKNPKEKEEQEEK